MDTFKQCPATKPAKSFYEGGKEVLTVTGYSFNALNRPFVK